MSNLDKNTMEKRLCELENKQKMLFIGVSRALEKLGVQQDDNLELFCLSRFTYEEFETFKNFLVESSIRLHNENLNKNQFIENYNSIFPSKQSLLLELMNVVDKSDEFENIRNLFFDRK